MRNNNKKDGFTLIELIIAIAIIGVLFVALTRSGNFFGTIGKARDSQRQIFLKSLHTSIEGYQIFEGEYPDSGKVLEVLKDNGVNVNDLAEDSSSCYYYGFKNASGNAGDPPQFFVAAKGSDDLWVYSGSPGVELGGTANCDQGPGVGGFETVKLSGT